MHLGGFPTSEIRSTKICEEIAWLHGKRFGQLDYVFERDVPFSALNAADVVAMQTRPLRQLFLRIAPLVAELPQPGAESSLNGACWHTPMLGFRPL